MADITSNFIFDYFLIIELKKTEKDQEGVPVEKYQFPKEVTDPDEKKFLSSSSNFSFPDKDEINPVVAKKGEEEKEPDRFSFVLTADSGGRRFGYCVRPHIPGHFPCAIVIISVSPCFAFFSKVLDEVIARMNMTSDPTVIDGFLEAIHPNKLPAPGQLFCVKVPSPWRKKTLDLWRFTRPDDGDTPLEYIDFQPLLRALSAKSVLRIYLSLLLERRIIFVSRSLQTLTACVQACVALLYPFEWQHVYIPLLPKEMMTFVCAPMPFIVGLLEPFLNDLADYLEMLEEVVIVNLDKDAFQISHKSAHCRYTIRSSYDDRSLVNNVILESLMTPIKAAKKQNKKQLSALGTKEKFLEGFMAFSAELLGGHEDYFEVTHEDGFVKVPFAEESHESIRPFLTKFVSTQMFEQFIMSTVARYFQGRGLNERPDLVKLFGGGGGAVRFREFQKGYETYAEKMDNAMQEKQSRRSKRPEKEAGPAFPGIRQQPAPSFPGVRMHLDGDGLGGGGGGGAASAPCLVEDGGGGGGGSATAIFSSSPSFSSEPTPMVDDSPSLCPPSPASSSSASSPLFPKFQSVSSSSNKETGGGGKKGWAFSRSGEKGRGKEREGGVLSSRQGSMENKLGEKRGGGEPGGKKKKKKGENSSSFGNISISGVPSSWLVLSSQRNSSPPPSTKRREEGEGGEKREGGKRRRGRGSEEDRLKRCQSAMVLGKVVVGRPAPSPPSPLKKE